MSDRDEQQPAPASGGLAPIRRIPRTFAWLIVTLRYPIIVAWIAAAVLMTLHLPDLGEESGGEFGGVVPDHSQALQAEKASLDQFDFPLSSRTMIIERDPAGLTPKQQESIVHADLQLSKQQEPQFKGILGALPIPNTLSVLPFATEEGTAVLSYLFTPPNMGLTKATVLADHLASERRAQGPATQVEPTGTVPAQIEQGNVISQHLIWLDIATVALVLLIVGLHFRALLPPLVALAAVGIGLLISIRLVAWVATQADVGVSSDVRPVMTVLLFGVLTDYSIFFMARFRAMLEEEGMDRVGAARRAAGELLPVVFTAGIVVSLATGSLYLAQLGFLHGLGPALGITVLVAMLVGTTFVPAMLALFGRAMLWPRQVASPESPAEHDPGVGGRAVRLAVRHPVAVASVCCLLLLAAASGLLSIHTSNPQMTNLPPDSAVNRGYVYTSEAFVPGMVAPTTVMIEGDGVARRPGPLDRLEHSLSQQPDVAGVIGPADNPLKEPLGVVLAKSGDAARYMVVFRGDPLGSRAISAIGTIRRRLPELMSRAGMSGTQALVGGDSALSADTANATHSDLLRVTPVAAAVIFLMLVLLLRALVAPLYLLVASFLGLLAALGLTTYFFQELLGHSGISIFVPLTIAVLLLSMGSDYNIFLVGRIWHEARVRPLREAIIVAGGRSTRAITVAGLVLAGSFGAAALIPLDSFRELAFGMAVGLLIDALIVRALLVPAMISIVGPVSGWPGKRPGTAASPVEDLPESSLADDEPAYFTDATNPRTSPTGSE